MFQWASDQFDKLTEAVAPPPTDAAGRFSYAVTRQDENTAMGIIAEIDPVRTVVNQSKGWFPIHMACQYSMTRLLRLLMNQPGVSIQQPDYSGLTPLHHACMSTQRATGLEVVKTLIKEYSADPCAKNSRGETPYDVATLDSIRQYILPIQLQRETQHALDNGGVGLTPGIDLAPPPQFGGAGVAAPPPAGAAAPMASTPGQSRYPQTPGMTSAFGSPMASVPQQQQQQQHQQQQQPIPAAQPIARAPASMPGRNSIGSNTAGRTQSAGESRHARSGGSSLAVYSKYKADGFHSSSSDVGLQRKYGHVGANTGAGVAPPPSSGNNPLAAPAGPNPFSSAGNFGGVSRYASYGPTAAPAPVSGPMYSGMGYGQPATAQTTPSYFTPGATAATAAAPSTPAPAAAAATGLTSPFMPPPPYSGTAAPEPVAAATTPAPATPVVSSPFVAPPSSSNNEPAASSLFESPPKVSEPVAEPAKEEPAPTAEPATSSTESSSDWVETVDPTSGQTYFFNSKTNETSWEKPTSTGESATQPAESESTTGESDWSETVDPSSGQTYYYNNKTGETSWEKPADTTAAASAAGDATGDNQDQASEWVEATDPSSGNTYYYNSVTGETSWERPAAMDEKPSEAAESSTTPVETTSEPVADATDADAAPAEEPVEESSPQEEPAPTETIPEETSSELRAEETTTETEEPTPEVVEEKVQDETPVESTPAEETSATEAETTTPEVASEETSTNALPEGWIEATDPSSGTVYYCNMNTQETSWERPVAEMNDSSEADTKPATEESVVAEAAEESTTTPAVAEGEWQEVQDPTSGKTYYFNKTTQETSWEKPTPTASEPAAATTTTTNDAAAAPSEEQSDWAETLDPSSGKNYYYNSKTGETSWEKPACLMPQEETPVATENEVQASAAEAATMEQTADAVFESKPQSSPIATPGHQRTLSAQEMFASPPAQSNGTPGPSTTTAFDRPSFISPAAATQGSVVSPGELSTPGPAATTAEDLFGASAVDSTPAKTAEDLFGATPAEPVPAPVPETTEANTTDDVTAELDDDEDGGMTDIPLSPEPVSLVKPPTTTLPSLPDTTAAAPAPAAKASDDLFAAIGMPPPPFQ
eukprot:CAMPEP_0116125268 /NCGR_PEP_ID=MMETSP0329-20121206/5721_1 /TAXON_ID=697910 /ORGANISM="Pseudo-nitzschia arenysensis, Strain B593" /LENGTH=1109 /DNA_ID=CAMNT_0003619299 /DNA_START=125 /DNA_END=3451 /DNA_ORIENTATION=+